MTKSETESSLGHAFARLSQAASRKKIYARKAAREGRSDLAHFLRAMSVSEAVQARRLFNSLIGRIYRSDEFVRTIFENEVQDILENYTGLMESSAAEKPALLHAIKQLKAAETRLLSFYSRSDKEVNISTTAEYFVCRFCGYLAVDSPPEKCPVCGADNNAFNKVI